LVKNKRLDISLRPLKPLRKLNFAS